MLTLTLHEIIPGGSYYRYIFSGPAGKSYIWRTKTAKAASVDIEIGTAYRITCRAVEVADAVYISHVKSIALQTEAPMSKEETIKYLEQLTHICNGSDYARGRNSALKLAIEMIKEIK